MFSTIRYAKIKDPNDPTVPGATGDLPKKKKDTNASLIKSLDSFLLCLSPKMIHSL